MNTNRIQTDFATERASRRSVLRGTCAVAAATAIRSPANADEPVNPASVIRAQTGDLLVSFDSTDPKKPITAADVKAGDGLVLAWPLDPSKSLVRDGSRLNLVILIRFDPSKLSDAEKQRGVDGVVAYTAVCTHQACWVTDWVASKQLAQCPCHQSEYDIRHGGKVVAGPAPRALPALPLKLADARLTVAGPFTDWVGGQKL